MICLFGGTFDPVHKGHIRAARAVCDALKLDCMHLIVAARPRHRGGPAVSAEHRLAMLRLACQVDRRLQADDQELQAGGDTYTYNTLIRARSRHPGETFAWLIGSDAFADLPQWYRWRELFRLTNFVVVTRPGDTSRRPATLNRVIARRRRSRLVAGDVGRVVELQLPLLEVSATAIRASLGAGVMPDKLLPARVCTYIRKHRLYGGRLDR